MDYNVALAVTQTWAHVEIYTKWYFMANSISVIVPHQQK